MQDWLRSLQNTAPQLFLTKRGKRRKATKRTVTVQHLYEAVAMRFWIMGRQNRPVEVRHNENALEQACYDFKKVIEPQLHNSEQVNMLH